MEATAELPLIAPPRKVVRIEGTASAIQTLGNIIVSLVGTGVLGLPFAFLNAGWLAGSIGIAFVGVVTYYCMLLLVRCREKIISEEGSDDTKTYGDLGFKCMGPTGRYLSEILIVTSHSGGMVAYFVFIGQNLSSIINTEFLNFSTYIFLLIPVQIALSWIGSISALAPFSLFATICNAFAICFVLKEDLEEALNGEFSFHDRNAATSLGGLLFAGGMAIFCFEGFGLTLGLQSSMRESHTFPKLLAKAFAVIISVYVLFGFSGYMAYGDQTKDIIMLNLPKNWSAIIVQLGLCLALIFTFPMMLHPIYEIIERKYTTTVWFQKHLSNNDNKSMRRLGNIGIKLLRAIIVIGLAVLASFVPGFGVFASLVGSTVCALLSFVLPTSFHLTLFGSSLSVWQRSLDLCILLGGLVFAVYATYSMISKL